jgi:drug/metabolite transporter (DMT)-like permease
MTGAAGDGERAGPGRGAIAGATLALFLVWSNTFLVFEELLRPAKGAAALRWQELVLLRFLPTAALCAAWLALARRREVAALVRAHPGRLLASAALCVPLYNSLLYFGMQHRVKGPVASVLTALAPLYVVALGAVFLRERLGPRRAIGLVLGLCGVGLLATAGEPGEAAGPLAVAVTALAPLAWAGYTVLTKPVTRDHAPLDWTFLVLAVGGLGTLPLLPFADGARIAALGGREVALLAYLVLAATLAGFAAWSWLLRHLPAGTVGLTIFLNPPLTLGTKAILAAAWPESFEVRILPVEIASAVLALAGVAMAVWRPAEPAR